MRNLNPILAGFLILPFLFSCASMLPVNSAYDKAKTLGKGNVELSGHVTSYVSHQYGRVDFIERHMGLRAGLGLSERFDLKLRYEHMNFSSNFDGQLRQANCLSIVPKYALVPEKLALLVPFSNYYYTSKAEGEPYKSTIRSIAPQIIYTYTTNNNKCDFSVSLKSDYLFTTRHKNEADFFMGTGLGAGFSKDLDRWAIRPEIGLSTKDGQLYWNYGVGFQYVLTKRK